ncbi:MAG: general secretion pathway protein GspD [Proteobacteria bacterium]|nr:general secretion pathway protein GspD [Pseudomonadota bacterium]
MNPLNRPLRRLLPLALAGLLAACATNTALDRSRAEFISGDPLAALTALEQRVRDEPRNLELRAFYLRQRERLASEYLAAAEHARTLGEFDRAEQLYRRAQGIDPTHPRVVAGIESLADERRRQVRLSEGDVALARGDAAAAERLARSVLAEVPANAHAQRLLREADEGRAAERLRSASLAGGPMERKVSLQFREAPLRAVFEALSHAAGLSFVFDREMRDDALVTLVVRDRTVGEVLKLLATTQQIETRLIDPHLVLVYPATPAKQRDYQDLVSRSFYLVHADTKQAQALVKQVVKTRDIFIDEKLNLLVIKDTPEAVRLAERLIASLDVAEPEVMLEVEVLEVARTKLRDIGLEFPDEIGYGLLASRNGGALVQGNVNLRRGGELAPFAANPAAVLRLLSEDGDSSTLANPRIRVKNRAAAKVHIGEKVPVFTTTSTANVGVAASVSYLDVGLKLEVEPSVTLDDQVAIKVGLEVSNIVREVPGPEGSLAYQLGTRSATTTLRLKNGETQVLAGLINDQDRVTARHLPGLGELPVLGRLFSSQRDDGSKTEIVLLITPRIVRNVVPPVSAREDLPAGTEASIGALPLRMAGGAQGSLSLRAAGPAMPGAGGLSAVVPPPAVAPPGVPGAADASLRDLAVRLTGPGTAKPGSTVTLALELGGSGRHDGGVIDVGYDPVLLEPVGFAAVVAGQASVALVPGALPSQLPLSFRVRAQGQGMASVAVTGVTLQVGGQRMASPASSSTTIDVVP